MSTISQFAAALKKSPQEVLDWCNLAGLGKQGKDDILSEEDKKRLLGYVRGGGTKSRQAAGRAGSGPVEVQRNNGGRNLVKVRRKGRQTAAPPPPPPPPPEKETPAPVEKPETPEVPEAAVEEMIKEPAVEAQAPAPAPERSPQPKPPAKPPSSGPKRQTSNARKGRGSSPKTSSKNTRKRGRLEIEEGHDVGRRRRGGGVKKTSPVKVTKRNEFELPQSRISREVAISGAMNVVELAKTMAVKADEVLLVLGGMQDDEVTLEDILQPEVAELVVEAMGHKAHRVEEEDEAGELARLSIPSGEALPRPPVVTVMGHVDHGKTSLLDYIRKTRVADDEAGGITQHIGAYRVETPHGWLTFLDTPGHAAFTSMRARGAQCTDLVVLVVAADDGVKPQTQEAIEHARAAKVPMLVALNKIDKNGADVKRVKSELAALEIQGEDWGGDTTFVPVSAKTGEGMEQLLEAIALQAEIMELKAPAEGMASGVIVESSLDRGRGVVATVLVQAGCLQSRDLILCGQEYGRVKQMTDDSGKVVKQAGPSCPVQVLGLSGVPQAGDPVHVLKDEQKMRELAQQRKERAEHRKDARTQEPELSWEQRLGTDDVVSLNVILKADVRGSGEALREALENISTDQAEIRVIQSGIGGINLSDASLAETSNSVLLGFNVRADSAARRVIAERGLEFRHYSVIYELLDDIRKMLEQRLEPEIREETVGLAEVLEIYDSSKMGQVAGCRVVEGSVQRGYPIRVLRDDVVIYEGELESLRRHKDDVKEVAAGTECGIAVAKYNDVQVKDQIEVYRRVEMSRTL